MPLFRPVIAVGIALLIAGCASEPASEAVPPPVMRWDFHPEAPAWTSATLAALEGPGAALAEVVPADIETFCPSYADNDADGRRAFWAGLISALAKYESSWNETASGGGGRWIGLLQISPRTAENYSCSARSAAALKDGPANLACGVRIAARQVARDGLVAGNGARGVGRDWTPFQSEEKRSEIAAWTRAQTYCR